MQTSQAFSGSMGQHNYEELIALSKARPLVFLVLPLSRGVEYCVCVSCPFKYIRHSCSQRPRCTWMHSLRPAAGPPGRGRHTWRMAPPRVRRANGKPVACRLRNPYVCVHPYSSLKIYGSVRVSTIVPLHELRAPHTVSCGGSGGAMQPLRVPWLLVLLISSHAAKAQAETLLRGVSNTSYVSIDLDGTVHVAAPRSAITAPFCAGLSGSIYTLELNSTSRRVHLVSKDKQPFYSYALPFTLDSISAFNAGLDWHLTSGEDDLFITGPDQLGFIHLLSVSPTAKSYTDVLQYGEGTRLSRGLSTFDTTRKELWVQVAYDTSKARPTNSDPFRAFLKRYDMVSGSLMDIVEDDSAMGALVYDSSLGHVYGLGWCAATPATRCLYRITTVNTTTPTIDEVASLPIKYQLIMAGVATTSKGLLYVVMAPDAAHEPTAAPGAPALKCHADPTDPSTVLCTRRGDAGAGADAGAQWQLVSIDLRSGKLHGAPTMLSWGSAAPKVLLCGVGV